MDGFIMSRLDNQRGVLADNISPSTAHLVLSAVCAKALSSFMIAYPDITVKLTLTDRGGSGGRGSILKFALGMISTKLYITRQLAANRRILCAPCTSNATASRKSVGALVQHDCL